MGEDRISRGVFLSHVRRLRRGPREYASSPASADDPSDKSAAVAAVSRIGCLESRREWLGTGMNFIMGQGNVMF